MKGLITTGGIGGVNSQLYLSVWSMRITYHDDNGSETYITQFMMCTSYEPTASNLSTFKTMIGANTGELYNTLHVIPYYIPEHALLQAMSINNSNISFTVKYDGSASRSFNEGSPSFEKYYSNFAISRIASRRIL